jgi:hypothetical protein
MASSNPQIASLTEPLANLRELVRRAPQADLAGALAAFQQRMVGELWGRLHMLRNVANPTPPQIADLPPTLVQRFVSPQGRHVLKVYGRGNIWDMDNLRSFVGDVKGVDPDATGQPLQTYYASRQMQEAYVHAAIYALIGVMIVLVLDQGSLRFALLAVMPMLLAMLQMFGIMGWLDIPLNPANMIVLPLFIGIGVDYGVFVMHDYRTQRGRFRLNWSTAIAILVSSLTTMVGFGSLMIASHQGLQSLGRVLTIGIMCCQFTSLLVLPAFLTWLSRNRADDPPEVSTDNAATDESAAYAHQAAELAHAVGHGLQPHFAASRSRRELADMGSDARVDT